MPNNITFQVGDISFSDFEVPEQLSDLGGRQVIALHEFPGGVKSAQLLGEFPKAIKWKGILWGATAVSRSFAIKQLVLNGEFLTLTYDEFSFNGIMTDYQVIAKSRWEIEYECEFEPMDDNSAGESGTPLPPSAADLLSQAGQALGQQTSAPASGFQFPSVVLASTGSLNNSLQSTLASSGFNLSNATAGQLGSLLSQVTSLRSILAPFVAGADPQASSAAAEADSSLALMASYIDAQLPPLAVLATQDPDLFALASTFYGDAGLWAYIADANSLTDPTPTGPFDLIIPSLAGLPPAA